MIYITGSEGFIGSRLQQILKQPYVCIDKKLGLDILTMDWNMFIRRYGAPQTIIHLAASTNPRESMKSIEEYYVNNFLEQGFSTFQQV
jgi:nucleoside-diphosphate-sugar epimerase